MTMDEQIKKIETQVEYAIKLNENTKSIIKEQNEIILDQIDRMMNYITMLDSKIDKVKEDKIII